MDYHWLWGFLVRNRRRLLHIPVVLSGFLVVLAAMAQDAPPRTETQWLSALTSSQYAELNQTLAKVLEERDQLRVQLRTVIETNNKCQAALQPRPSESLPTEEKKP